jgi:hypothetical protein
VQWLFVFGIVVLAMMLINLPLKWMNRDLANSSGSIPFARMNPLAKASSAVLIALLAFSLAWGVYGMKIFFSGEEPCEHVGVHRFGWMCACLSALVCFACTVACLGVSCVMCKTRWFAKTVQE